MKEKVLNKDFILQRQKNYVGKTDTGLRLPRVEK